jgi:hypothetical protein
VVSTPEPVTPRSAFVALSTHGSLMSLEDRTTLYRRTDLQWVQKVLIRLDSAPSANDSSEGCRPCSIKVCADVDKLYKTLHHCMPGVKNSLTQAGAELAGRSRRVEGTVGSLR